MAVVREAWLDLTKEDPLEPDLPICDSHHHLWNRPGRSPGYYLDAYLRDASSGHNIVKTVYVECHESYRTEGPQEFRPVGETEAVAACTRKLGPGGNTRVAAGIVAHADLTFGKSIIPVLEAHLEAGDNRVRGIRQICLWDASPAFISYVSKGLMMEPKFRAGFACLERYGLVFDSTTSHAQLNELTELARAFPATLIIVDHAGLPLGLGPYRCKDGDVYQLWKFNMSELATCPNVFVKLGGLGMPMCGFGWQDWYKPPSSLDLAHDMEPYYGFCIEKFGTKRCMFESNFPPDKESYSYNVMWNAFKRICTGFSQAEKADLFHDTAVSVYRLG